MSEQDCDVLIAGGGLVGMSLALALAGLRVIVVDKAPMAMEQRSADERHLALSEVSCRILTELNVLQALGADAEPIRSIHVSSARDFGAARWSATDLGRVQFGVVAPAKRLLRALQQRVLISPGIALRASATVLNAQTHSNGVDALIEDPQGNCTIRAKLLVIADGADSSLRSLAGIEVTRHDYQTSAICCVVEPEREHQGTAFERFTRNGLVAMLPQSQGRCAAVFIVDSTPAGQLMQMPNAAFLHELQAAFGYRLGRLRHCGLRVAYPLRRVLAQTLVAPRQVLIGNAAQSVHPVGAQGFNLGLRDAAELAQALLAAQRNASANTADFGAADLLAAYASSREKDRAATTQLSHALALSTTLHARPVGWLRSLALIAADRIRPLAEHLQLAGMGYRGATPGLDRGLIT